MSLRTPFESWEYLTHGDQVITLPPEEQVPEKVYYHPFRIAGPNATHPICGIQDLHKITRGKGVKVAVLDTGCDPQHSSYRDRLVKMQDFTGNGSGGRDGNGHGTHCAGIAVGGDNSTCPIGVAPEASLYVGKVLSDGGSGLSSWIADGIDWATEQDVDVISMSLGSDSPDSMIHEAIIRAVSRGVIVVAAAGNAGPGAETIGYPGGFPEVICVGAIDNGGIVARFSSRGAAIDTVTPGVSVLSAYPGDRTATMSGTSMATPYMAGLMALLISADKRQQVVKLPADKLAIELGKYSADIKPAGFDPDSAWGYPKLLPLFQLLGVTPPEPPLPPPPPEGDLYISIADLKRRGIKRVITALDY